MTSPTYQAVPITYNDEKIHRRLLAQASNQHNQGKFNCTIELTLNANSTSTTLYDQRIGAYSLLVLTPVTQHAAQEISGGGLYIAESTMLNGSAVITHVNNTQTDRNFRVGIFG
jgi:hypothetical protein